MARSPLPYSPLFYRLIWYIYPAGIGKCRRPDIAHWVTIVCSPVHSEWDWCVCPVCPGPMLGRWCTKAQLYVTKSSEFSLKIQLNKITMLTFLDGCSFDLRGERWVRTEAAWRALINGPLSGRWAARPRKVHWSLLIIGVAWRGRLAVRGTKTKQTRRVNPRCKPEPDRL